MVVLRLSNMIDRLMAEKPVDKMAFKMRKEIRACPCENCKQAHETIEQVRNLVGPMDKQDFADKLVGCDIMAKQIIISMIFTGHGASSAMN